MMAHLEADADAPDAVASADQRVGCDAAQGTHPALCKQAGAPSISRIGCSA